MKYEQQEQVEIMPPNPNKAPGGLRAAAGIAQEGGRGCTGSSLVHIHVHTLHIKSPCNIYNYTFILYILIYKLYIIYL